MASAGIVAAIREVRDEIESWIAELYLDRSVTHVPGLTKGRLWWKGGKHYLAKALERELVGIKHLGYDWVQIQFGPVVLGEIKKGKFLPKQPIARKHR